MDLITPSISVSLSKSVLPDAGESMDSHCTIPESIFTEISRPLSNPAIALFPIPIGEEAPLRVNEGMS